MGVYLRAKFQVFSTILTTFRRGNSPHPEQIKNLHNQNPRYIKNPVNIVSENLAY